MRTTTVGIFRNLHKKKRVRESEEKEVLKEINHLKEKVQNNPSQDMEDLEKAKEKMEQIRK